MSCITVDLDWPSKLMIRRTWYRVVTLGYDPEGRVSASGHGVHIRSKERPVIPIEVNEKERRYANDDKTRIYGDKEDRLPNNQVLWDQKNGQEAGSWTDDLETVIGRYQRSCNLTPTQHKRKHDY